MAGELGWDHAVDDIPERGLTTWRTATPEELAHITKALELLACSSLSADYAITPTGGDRFRLSGQLKASLQQACVVTLEPIASEIDEAFAVEFWPASEFPTPENGEIDLDDEPLREPIVAGRIDVGRIVYESLAGAIDPFPRKSDAALDRASAGPAGDGQSKPESPFAVLARIKEKN